MPYYNQFFIPLFLKYIPFQSSFKKNYFLKRMRKKQKTELEEIKKELKKKYREKS